jgi:predicted transcriptional regulator
MADASINHLTADIVSAYARSHHLSTNEVATLISTVHQALDSAGKPVDEVAERTPAVLIRRSVTADYVVCLECGWRGKMLRRHLSSRHGLSPGEYRTRWKLHSQHPLTAPAYSEQRSSLAKELGLGRGRAGRKMASGQERTNKQPRKARNSPKRARATKSGSEKRATGRGGRARS